MLQIPEFNSVNILVSGDVMLDRYWTGGAARISPEAPVPVVDVSDALECPGGAGNVVLNIASLGAKATLLGLAGKDESGEMLERLLSEAEGVESAVIYHSDVATITKLRVISSHQQLVRLDFEQSLDDAHVAEIADTFQQRLDQADVVIMSDYGKGALRDVQRLIQQARTAGKPVLVDPKGRDFSIYAGASVVTPNFSEFEVVVGPCAGEDQIVQRGTALMDEHNIDALVITRSEKGMTLLQRGMEPLHIPAQAQEVFDVTGAGDTVIAVLAAGMGAGLELGDAARLANVAAGIVIGKLGAATVSIPEIRRCLHELDETYRSVLSEEHLIQMVEDSRAHGERIVMTNGCFDILHAGHVRYLEQARRLGDRLVVAVNDDDSVRKLKGSTRPIISQAERMEVLAGLSAVDWVVPFSEDTPERLVCEVKPDILVKGGDYKPEQVAGHQCAGETKVLGFVEGCSTSNIIDAIVQNMGDG